MLKRTSFPWQVGRQTVERASLSPKCIDIGGGEEQKVYFYLKRERESKVSKQAGYIPRGLFLSPSLLLKMELPSFLLRL